MHLDETKINHSGLKRCCIQTICDLLKREDLENGMVIDCKRHSPGNQKIILEDGIWRRKKEVVPIKTRGTSAHVRTDFHDTDRRVEIGELE